MQLSKYLKIFPYSEKPDHFLFYSTKQASVATLNKAVYEAIEKDELSASLEAQLLKLGIIVPDRDQEKQYLLNFLNEINKKNTSLSIVIVLNLDCNFSCVYCFEGDMKGKLYMSVDTADDLICFIKEKFTDHKQNLRIDFYGGEPLLSVDLIRYISTSIRGFADSKKAFYNFSLVTNGSLFTRVVAEELVDLGLTNVQITLDGPAATHNKFRPFKSGNGSFITILKNIHNTWDLVKIGIVGNFEKNNYNEFVSLLDFIEQENLSPDRISSIRFAPIINRPEGEISPTDYQSGCMSINEPWLLDAERLLREEILKRGYYTPKPMPTPCAIEFTDSFVVNFDGDIYKCPAFIGKADFVMGNLKKSITSDESAYNLDIWKNEDCLDCEYLPLCFGGCRYMAYVRDGNIENLDCRKEYLDESLETLIKQDIRLR